MDGHSTSEGGGGPVAAWRADRAGVSIDLLRIGIGFIWALDLLFILLPANQYFPTFATTAQSYGPQTLGGPAIANFVAANSLFFAWLIAGVTVYLAVAFLLGITTRLACYVGIVASAFFFVTQYSMTFMFPGGTDVGAHPLYLLIYLVLIAGGGGRYFAADGYLVAGPLRYPRWTALLCTAPGRPATGGAAAPTGSSQGTPLRRRRPFAVTGVVAIVAFAALLSVAVAEELTAPGAVGVSPSMVAVTGVEYQIDYPGNVSTGPFGPAQQSGCYACAEEVAPGNLTSVQVMLTNSERQDGQTVESLAVAPPFALVSGPSLPELVKPNWMWMFVVEIRAPSAPGSYTVELTFTVE